MRAVIALLGQPKFLRAFHGYCVGAWLILWVLAARFGWIYSVEFISHISIAAGVLGSWSSWQASRVEVAVADQVTTTE